MTPELLRAWEQRYGLLRPVRTPGGFRIYGEEDAERVARMRQALDEGLSAAEAARAALEAASSPDGLIEDARARLIGAIESYDEAGVQAALDDGLAAFGLEAFVRDLILPTLIAVGRGWEQGRVEISQEHFASNLIRGGCSRSPGSGAAARDPSPCWPAHPASSTTSASSPSASSCAPTAGASSISAPILHSRPSRRPRERPGPP